MAEQKKGVRTQHPSYEDMCPLWTRCQDAAKGEHAIHAAGVAYLPKLAEEEAQDYENRKGRTPFFNATWRTISGLKGMLFRKDPAVNVPASITAFLEDVDMAGTPMDLLAQEISEELLTVGRVGLLVDRPPMPEREDGKPLTVADTEKMGLRPTIQKYSAKSIINWKVGRVGNALKLVMVVLAETADVESEDEFGHKTEERYRVLDLVNGAYRQRVFRIVEEQDELVEDYYPLMNNQPMPEIPFIFIGVNDINAEIDEPPLIDLVDMNIHHYQVSSDFEHGCHFSGLPTLFVTGHRTDDDTPKIYIGGPSANVLSDPQAQAFYAEVEGGFEALLKNLENKKNEMAVLGARMLESQKNAVEAADTLAQRSHGEQSQLASQANVESMGIEAALEIFTAWAGATGTVEYRINTDYVPAGMSAQELTALTAAWQAGLPGTSDQNVYRLMQLQEMADPDATYEEEQERMSTREPKLLESAE